MYVHKYVTTNGIRLPVCILHARDTPVINRASKNPPRIRLSNVNEESLYSTARRSHHPCLSEGIAFMKGLRCKSL